jgi:hypothetical protein
VTIPAAAAQILGARNLRRLFGCGCAAAAALAAMPVLGLVTIVNGLIPGSGDGGGNQVDAAAGTVIGAAQPLQSGRFSVSQGFGCTEVAAEPAPPRPYACPPDGAHPAFVRFHTGIDLAAASGAPVFAVADGTVQVVESKVGFGVHILLVPSAQPAVVYLYGHLSGSAFWTGTPSAQANRLASWAARATAQAPTCTSRSTPAACRSIRAPHSRPGT